MLNQNLRMEISNFKNLFENVFSIAWRIVFFSGGIICAFYFIEIRRIPIANFQDAFNLLFIIALIGLSLFAFLTISFIVSTITWRKILKEKDFCSLFLDEAAINNFQISYEHGISKLSGFEKLLIFLYV